VLTGRKGVVIGSKTSVGTNSPGSVPRNCQEVFWSVMIPTYQPLPGYLRATLQSVLQQDPGPDQMQIEVLDDHSPDGAPNAVAAELGGDRIPVHRNPRNLGLAGTWNECIARAKGQWIHILHQDDLVQPGFYSRLRAGIENKPEAGAAFCRHAYMDAQGRWTYVSELEQSAAGYFEQLQARLAAGCIIQCPSIVVRKDTYDTVGRFRSDLSYSLDWDMWLRISLARKVWYEPEVLACWREHGLNSTTRQKRAGKDVGDIRGFLRIAESYFPEGNRHTGLAQARLRYALRAVDSARAFAAAGDGVGAKNQLRGAWRLCPSARLIPGTIKCLARLLRSAC
jgi:glycosyltransferase involved in cell wall biosynthesis